MTWDRFRPDAGRRLLPQIVDELAREIPNHILYEFATPNPSSTASTVSQSYSFTKVSARTFANAVNRASWLLEKALGRGGAPEFPTIGYTGPQDLRYIIFVLAAVKVGYKMLFTSLRNSVEGDAAVVEAAHCKTWLVPSHGSNVQRLLDHGVALRTVSVPDLSEFLDETPVPEFPYTPTWEEAKRHPLWVLHTSGSTGNPKPVVRFLDSAASIGANNLLPKVGDRWLLLHDYFDSRVYLTFPLFHAAGLANGLLWTLFHGTTVIFGPPDKPVSLPLMSSVIKSSKPDAVFTAPSLVAEISNDVAFLELLKSQQVRSLAYGGGPVSKEAGDRVWKYIKLRLSIGTTETGWLPCLETDPEDWNYIHLHPNAGFEMQDQGADLYELVAVRKPEFQDWQPIFSTFPDISEYRFKDLFSPHPSKKGLYKYEGRADNIIVLSNGEKVQPQAMELSISANAIVDAIVVAGQGRFQTFALVQVAPGVSDTSSEAQILEALWPIVEEANKSAPGHAQLQRHMILIASTDKPFLKTSKGTVRRGPTIDLYASEIDALYERAEREPVDGSVDVPIDFSSEETLRGSLRQALISLDIGAIGDEDDFFAVGALDSLQVLTLRRILATAVAKTSGDAQTIQQTIIYANPSIALLSKALLAQLSEQQSPNGTIRSSAERAQEQLDKLIATLPVSLSHNSQPPHTTNGNVSHPVVILTGSTGSLGSYILNDLLQLPNIQVWCINRSSDAPERQKESNRTRGLVSDFDPERVQFRQANLADENLGLPSKDYEFLAQHATHILHTQWRVDFNVGLSSFQPQLDGVRNLVAFALTSALRPKVLFASSVGVANGLIAPQASVPETPIRDFSSAAGSGYGESKLVAEGLLLAAAERSGLEVVISRIGQIAGPVTKEKRQGGLWNRREWFPSLLDASAYLSLLPESLGRNDSIDWIPVDILSGILLQLAGLDKAVSAEPTVQCAAVQGPASIFHCVNPTRVQWQQLLPTFQHRLSQSQKSANATESQTLQVVELEKWIEALRSAAENAQGKNEAAVSAFKLVPFFEGLKRGSARPKFETENTTNHSTLLRDLLPVQTEWVNTWLDQWGY